MTTRKPRAMPTTAKKDDALATTASAIDARAHAMWMEIRTLYVTSPEAPTIEDLSRRFAGRVGYEAIKRRAADEKWSAQRDDWWKNAEVTLLERIQDEYLAERLHEMRQLREAMPFVFEHMMPVMEKDPDKPGQKRVKRDPDTGMPVFRHPFKSQEGVMRTWLALQERQMLLRGEATMRTESALRDRVPQADESDPLAHMAAKANFSRDEVRSLARQMIAKRMSADAEPDATDEEPDDDTDDDAEADEEV